MLFDFMALERFRWHHLKAKFLEPGKNIFFVGTSPYKFRSSTPQDLTPIICFVASEVNRLKLIVDDLKVSHEEKDNAISRVQIEIERLREVCDPIPCH